MPDSAHIVRQPPTLDSELPSAFATSETADPAKTYGDVQADSSTMRVLEPGRQGCL